MSWKVSLEATAFNSGQFPPEGLPEIAMAGRSNVGKSTLVNAILGTKLAHVGRTPGKTRSVNFYLVDAGAVSFRLVDLPGYGYAKSGKAERRAWSQLTSSYVENRGSLVLVCHLADFRHGLTANDRALQEWLSARRKPFMVLFTKADKISRGKRRALLQEYVRDGLSSIDIPIVTSGEDRSGVEEARTFMQGVVDAIKHGV
ncbi:MAG: ribosome biogenesis GTP-binding protein YihA/YsxC [Synergistaceae bacterium]|nr:ribosome biogenesis GTP-binding protein YihA/YsxC [Synergistaceae bacterium]